EYLALPACKFTVSGATKLSKAQKLVGLDLSQSIITEQGFQSLANLPSLDTVKLVGCAKLTGNAFREIEKFQRLRVISISGQMGKPKIADEMLEGLSGSKTLRILTVQAYPPLVPNHISARGVEHLSKAKNLRTLRLVRIIIDDDLAHALVALKEQNFHPSVAPEGCSFIHDAKKILGVKLKVKPIPALPLLP
ncbi:MAG: hypothetical protein K2Z81_09095, partial [Cyanobacteria bacterium]|nr:hypothetical protein [Cyanobacteriota bacterium]